MKLNHPLMYNNISSEDLKAIKRFLKKKNIVLTQSRKLKSLKKNGQNGLVLNTQLL